MFKVVFYCKSIITGTEVQILGSDGTWPICGIKTTQGAINRLKRCVKPSPIAIRAFLTYNDRRVVEIPLNIIGSEYVPDKPKYDEANRVFNGSLEYFTDQDVRFLKRGAMEILIVYSIAENRPNKFLSGKDLLYKKLSDNTWAVYRKS